MFPRNNDFDRQFNKMEKMTNGIFRFTMVAWVVYSIFILSMMITIGLVAWHFISKFW